MIQELMNQERMEGTTGRDPHFFASKNSKHESQCTVGHYHQFPHALLLLLLFRNGFYANHYRKKRLGTLLSTYLSIRLCLRSDQRKYSSHGK
jgi:hypothetical protein